MCTVFKFQNERVKLSNGGGRTSVAIEVLFRTFKQLSVLLLFYYNLFEIGYCWSQFLPSLVITA